MVFNFNKLFTEEELQKIKERKIKEKENTIYEEDIVIMQRDNIFSEVNKVKVIKREDKLKIEFGEYIGENRDSWDDAWRYYFDSTFISTVLSYDKNLVFSLDSGRNIYCRVIDLQNFVKTVVTLMKESDIDIVGDYTPGATEVLNLVYGNRE